jgi:uncharacterized SAM-binding protein YcdF (DUF218 family)
MLSRNAGTAGRSLILFCFFLLSAVQPLWSQVSVSSGGEASSLVGLRLEELVARFGLPQTVYASRGQEPWQDDVVFVYKEGDFYIYKDRVWQAGLKSAYGVSLGDSKPAVLLMLGEEAADQGDYILVPLPSGGWPLMLRVNLNASGRVSAIFIFRPDF